MIYFNPSGYYKHPPTLELIAQTAITGRELIRSGHIAVRYSY